MRELYDPTRTLALSSFRPAVNVHTGRRLQIDGELSDEQRREIDAAVRDGALIPVEED